MAPGERWEWHDRRAVLTTEPPFGRVGVQDLPITEVEIYLQ